MIRIIEIDTEQAAARSIAETGADPYAVSLMAPKAVQRAVVIEDVDNRAASLLKQELLSLGGDAAVSHAVSRFAKGKSSVLLIATSRHIAQLIVKLQRQPFGLKALAGALSEALSNYDRERFVVSCRGKKLSIGGQPLIMGILNVTPDSFSDGNKFFDVSRAVAHGLAMAASGAHMIDVGGESSRPGSSPVGAAEEIRRVVPVIKELAKKISLPISVDTYKPAVAAASLKAGAHLVNDITALRHQNGAMADVARRYGAGVILMHMRGTPRTMQKAPVYRDVAAEIAEFFSQRISYAVQKGIRRQHLILDPGIGFGKSVEHNLEILRRLKEFRVHGLPIAVGTSRKSFIGKISGEKDPGRRMAGSVASAVWAAINGARIVRVHDVKETSEALGIVNAINRGTEE